MAANFDTVIVILNSPEQIELGWVEDGSLGDIDACMWVGHPGINGFIAIGEVLNSAVNPSGRLVDIWQADMTKDPSYYNIMENLQAENGTTDYVYTDETGADHLFHAVEYSDANGNGHTGYELDGGEYAIKLMNNSHDVIDEVKVTIEAQNFDTDRVTGNTVENLFSSKTDVTYNSLYVKYDENGNALYDGKGGFNHDMVIMSRADFAGTFPTAPIVTVGENGKVGSEGTVVMTIDADTYQDNIFPFTAGSTEDEAAYPWYEYLM